MTFDIIPANESIFLDANILIYHFTAHARYGAACTRLVERIERSQIRGFTSAHILSDMTHRLMTIEAMIRLGWPANGIAARLRRHHAEIPNLQLHRQALARIPQLGIQVLSITEGLVQTSAHLGQQFELLVGDASIVAVMQANGLTNLASNDADFDRVPGLTRYAPI